MSVDSHRHAPALAITWGILCGMRSMLAPAVLSRKLEHVPLQSRIQRALTSPPVRTTLQTLALLELAADKTPFVPSRLSPMALAGRTLSGALMGLAAAPPLSPLERAAATPPKESKSLRLLALALLGAGAAMGSAYASYFARKAATERLGVPNAAAGAVEDGLAMLVATNLT